MTATAERPVLLVGFGVLSWLVPFVVSIPLVGPGGAPVTDVFAFKSVVILVGAAVGAVLLAYYVPRLNGGRLRDEWGPVLDVSLLVVRRRAVRVRLLYRSPGRLHERPAVTAWL